MMRLRILLVGTLCLAGATMPGALAQENPFLGRWALTPANGGAGWLEVRNEAGFFEGALLWMGGSPEPQTSIYFDNGTLYALRLRYDEIRDAGGKLLRTQAHPILLTATLDGDALRGVLAEPSQDGSCLFKQEFTGARIPPAPPAPDLSKIRLGDPIVLFNGKNLDGWAVIGGAHWAQIKAQTPGANAAVGWVPSDKDVANGWTVKDGILRNDPVQQEGRPYIRYGNLATRQEFEDFNLTLDVKVIPNGNSGIYLRGIYEIQVVDSFGKPLDSHNMGALYGRIAPAMSAEKPAGEWQSLDITLCDRHVTIKLNGQTIIDNQPIAGCTGGALWSDESIPGPLYFQGDHTGVEYRNIVVRPILK